LTTRATILPIEAVVPELHATLARSRNFVLQAEPGAGKTTRVPLVVLEHDSVGFAGEILVSQPRRIAARMAATRVASLIGEDLGERIGYQVRFESRSSQRTRIRFVTEGILAQRIRSDPRLQGVTSVILDEFHERHLDTDVSLALLRHVQTTSRPDLRLVVMSATLDPEPIAAYLDGPALRCPGRTYPVEIDYLERGSDRSLGSQVEEALRELGSVEGSVLVFLPGGREIRECVGATRAQAERLGLDVVVLHGELSASEQDRAVDPARGSKLILSTNVAETSVTIEGVAMVIDSGLARIASDDAWSGLSKLTLGKISQASAVQRAGRAGRTRAGRCLRLYTKHDFDRRPPFDVPEILRLDLARAVLDLRAAGLQDPAALAWFESPPSSALRGAETLLVRLDAVDPTGRLTAIGEEMLRLPIHPRLARLVVEGRRLGIGHLAAGAAALLAERSIRKFTWGQTSRSSQVGSSDVAVELEALGRFASSQGRDAQDLDPTACRTVLRVWDQLAGKARPVRTTVTTESALATALLVAFPDRVAKTRPGSDEIVFADGGSAVLAPECVVRGAEYVVAIAAEERRSGTKGPLVLVRSAAEVDPSTLLDRLADQIEERVDVRFDDDQRRVVAHEELRYGNLVLDTRRLTTLPSEATRVLQQAVRTAGPGAFVEGELDLEPRSAFARRFDPRIPRLDREAIMAILDTLCEGCSSFAELQRFDVVGSLLDRLPADTRTSLDRLAPSHVVLAGGRRLSIHYELDRDPWVESHLQDFFGSSRGPTVASGQQPLVLHLLAPNRRAVQVTTDLAGFWIRHYPALRRELMRRYPRHAWPEDPSTATPPGPSRSKR